MLRQVLSHAAAQIDRVVVSTVLSRSARARQRSRAESLGHDERMRALEHIRALYNDPAHFHDPDLFFVPPAPIAPSQARVRSLPGGEVVDATWTSDFRLVCADVTERYFATPQNQTVTARVWRHHGPARPAAILIHGYRTGHFALEERMMPVAWLYERGMDVALFVLPFHASRGEGGRALFPSTDPRITTEGFRQAMLDLRALARWLRSRGAPGVGVLGMSLGGYTASLLATVEADLSFVVPVIPLASIADFAREGGRYVGSSEEMQLQHEALEAAFRAVSPLARPARLSSDRILVIGGEADRITPIAHARQLATHFGAPLSTFAGGHLLQFGRASSFREVGRMLGRLGMLAPRV